MCICLVSICTLEHLSCEHVMVTRVHAHVPKTIKILRLPNATPDSTIIELYVNAKVNVYKCKYLHALDQVKM